MIPKRNKSLFWYSGVAPSSFNSKLFDRVGILFGRPFLTHRLGLTFFSGPVHQGILLRVPILLLFRQISVRDESDSYSFADRKDFMLRLDKHLRVVESIPFRNCTVRLRWWITYSDLHLLVLASALPADDAFHHFFLLIFNILFWLELYFEPRLSLLSSTPLPLPTNCA